MAQRLLINLPIVVAAVSAAMMPFFAIAPDGSSAQEVRLGFAVASMAIGASLALAAVLSYTRRDL